MYTLLHAPETGAASDRLVRRDADGALIPRDLANADWQAFAKWRAEGNEPAQPEPAAASVPASISDRQFAQALADLGVITRPEALAFVKRGEVPAALQSAIDAIPDETERFAADMQVSGATVFERAHPSTLALAHALGWTAGQMDDLWRSAAGL